MKGIKTFGEFAKSSFLRYIRQTLATVRRLEIAWDSYYESSIKNGTRLSRGKGSQRKVTPSTRMPTERATSWKKFLRHPDNKSELIELLSNTIYESDALYQVILF